jgi:hypothetical protein
MISQLNCGTLNNKKKSILLKHQNQTLTMYHGISLVLFLQVQEVTQNSESLIQEHLKFPLKKKQTTLDKGNFHDLLLKFQRGFRTFWRGKDNKIITVGYSKQSDRQVQLYDLKNLDKPLDSVKSDNAASTVFPHFDETINILYLCGRSDSTIRLFEIGEDYIEFLTSHRF